jgi:hypothetical protein
LNHAGAVPFNVFVMMLHGTSKNAFVRRMPRSWEYMVKNLTRALAGINGDATKGGFQFNGYNAVDFSAKDTLVALMSGF